MEIFCLSLGVQPVGAADWLAFGGEGTGPWLKGKYDNAPEILGTTELNYESIAALKPNLILDVRSSGDQERYDTLSAIAPVVGIPEGADNWLTDRDTQLEIIGQALGKTDEAKTQQEESDKRISDIAVEHPGWADKTVAVVAKKRPPQAFSLGTVDATNFALDKLVPELEKAAPEAYPRAEQGAGLRCEMTTTPE